MKLLQRTNPQHNMSHDRHEKNGKSGWGLTNQTKVWEYHAIQARRKKSREERERNADIVWDSEMTKMMKEPELNV